MSSKLKHFRTNQTAYIKSMDGEPMYLVLCEDVEEGEVTVIGVMLDKVSAVEICRDYNRYSHRKADEESEPRRYIYSYAKIGNLHMSREETWTFRLNQFKNRIIRMHPDEEKQIEQLLKEVKELI